MAPDDPRHGTENGYGNRGCRCAACTEAHRIYYMGKRRRAGMVPRAEWEAARRSHGISGYKKRGCRCDICRAAGAAQKRRWRQRTAIACVKCGAPRSSDSDTRAALRGSKSTGLCHPCWLASRRKATA